MKFMDKKEQVLDIQMTPYGEYLLAQGEFKPEYYAFFDDNILYDSSHADISEAQNNIEARVQEDTPQLEGQVVFSDRNIFSRKDLTSKLGIVNQLGKVVQEEDIEQNSETITDLYFERKMYGLKNQLGTSDILKTDAPAWSINMIRGEIASSSKSITGSATALPASAGGVNWYSSPTINVPQINIDLNYIISVKSDIQFVSDTELAVEYPNSQYLDVKPEFVLAQILERNSEFSKDNFELEVFLVEEENAPGTSLKVEKLKKLEFKKPVSLVSEGILRDPSEIPESSGPITQDHVEYYLNILVDNQIDTQLICSSLEDLESRGFFIDTEIECRETKNISLVDIYSTDAVSPECPDPDNPCDNLGTIY